MTFDSIDRLSLGFTKISSTLPERQSVVLRRSLTSSQKELRLAMLRRLLIILIELIINDFSLFLKLLSDLLSSFEVYFRNVIEETLVLSNKGRVGTI